MVPRSTLGAIRISVLATCLVVLACFSLPLAPAAAQKQQQQSSPPQQSSQPQAASQAQANPQPEEPKRKKVWTNDDVVSLRTPADNYRLEQEAKEAAAAQAAAQAAKRKASSVAEPAEKLPETVEETQKLIAAKERQIANDQQALDRYNTELPTEPVERKDRMQEEIKRITAFLPKEELELKELQDHLEKLTKAQETGAPASSPSPAPPSR